MVSEVIDVELTSGEVVHLACGMKPLIRNRLFRFFEFKLKYIVSPAAVAAFFVPTVRPFIENHFQVEIIMVASLGLLGFYVSLPRAFSRRPGAMIYLAERSDPPGTD
jgi:hypothetical protein